MTVRKINLITDIVATDQLIRCDQLASEFNQQLFRQGRVYDVKLDLDYDGLDSITVWALNPTWIIRESWKLAFRKFNEHMREEMKVLKPANKARWHDFRVDPTVIGAGIVKGVNWTAPGTGAAYNPVFTSDAEYQYTDINDEDGTTYYFTLGAHPTGSALSITTQYLANYHVTATPDDIADAQAPYSVLDDQLQHSNMTNLMKDGNNPPYDPDPGYNDRMWIKVGTLGTSPGGVQSLSTGYFQAPMGFVIINGYTQSEVANSTLSLSYKPGNYKGISARSMEEL